MARKPIFVATHPRACSTAFERVFMTRRDGLQCAHEPFGDAFYYGPERLSDRYEDDEQARLDSGFSQTTYGSVVERLDRGASEEQGKRLFIKDMAYYLVPLDGKPVEIAPSFASVKRVIGTNGSSRNGTVNNGPITNAISNGAIEDVGNPTVMPTDLLKTFHFAFLIRDPHYSIPSYYRCTIPPLEELTGFTYFTEAEAGYDELRRLFDYLRKIHLIGPHNANNPSSASAGNEICVVDADTLLDNPHDIIERFCESVGEEFTPDMLDWHTEEEQGVAQAAFAKWRGFHEDVLNSDGLRARVQAKQTKTESQFDEEWLEKYGENGAKTIRSAVDKCMPDYLYMKKFELKA